MASMTKEELKSAIINHGLSPPPSNAKKEEYVEMYNEYVAPVADDAGEFSSDDEVSVSPTKRSSQKSRTSAKSPRVSQATGSTDTTLEMAETSESVVVNGDVNIETLDDDQLFQLLKDNGVDVGPIVDSTRPLYKKKLANILSGGSGILNGTSNGTEFSDVDTEEEEEAEEDQPAAVVTPKERTSARGKASSSSQKSTRSSTRVSQKSPTADTSPLSTEAGLRKRLTLGENSETSLLRNTPTPRRSIHSYKVTETTRQTVVLDKSGERRDITRTVERVESKDAVDSSTAASRAASIKKMLMLLVVLALVGALVYYFAMGPGTESVKNILDSVRKIEVSSGDALPAAVGSAPPAPKAA
jgi:hypothetical protein